MNRIYACIDGSSNTAERMIHRYGGAPLLPESPPAASEVVLPPEAEVFASSRFGLYVCLGWTLLAVLVGLATPHLIPLDFLQEGGPIETGTIFLYIVALLVVLLVKMPEVSRTDRLAIGVVLVALAAREADLHTSLFGISVLKARFYNRLGSPAQIAAALAMLMPIGLSVLWLVVRHGKRWFSAPSTWTTTMATIAVFIAALVLVKAVDRLPDTIPALGIAERVPETLLYVLLSVEEIFELALPALAVMAVVQTRGLFPAQPSGASTQLRLHRQFMPFASHGRRR